MNKQQNIQFSIVMPVYGVENYLDKSIQSVLHQTYQNYEIILVNDCTQDKSGEICEKYAKQYENILYLKHDRNKGLSEARNTGLEKATGDYILFLDSDDYFESNMLEIIEKSLQKNRADIVVYGIIEEYMKPNNEEIDMTKIFSLNTQYFKNREFHKMVIDLEQETLYGYAWNKAYRLAYIRKENLKFEVIKHIEDIQFNVRCFENAETLNILEQTLYHYVQHAGQRLTTKKIENYFELQKQRIQMIMEQQKRWDVYTDKVKQILALSYFRYFFSNIERCICQKQNKKQIKQFMKTEYTSELYKELQSYCQPKSLVTKMLYFPAKNHNYFITILYAEMIHFVKTRCHSIFAKLKQTRK